MPSTGQPLALMDGHHVTTLRTAAAAALSISVAAREDARVLTVVGSGVQARAHLQLLAAEFEEVRVFARDRQKAEEIGAEYGARVRGRPWPRRRRHLPHDRRPREPLVRAADVAPGTHVTSVGYAPPGGELDPELARHARLIVESRAAFAPPPAGCAELAGLDPAAAVELGEILLGRAAGRESRGTGDRLQGDGPRRRGRGRRRARLPAGTRTGHRPQDRPLAAQGVRPLESPRLKGSDPL